MARKPWVPRPLRRPLAPLRRALDRLPEAPAQALRAWVALRARVHRLLLQATITASEAHLRRVPDPRRDPLPQALHWAPGVSLVIPERGGVDLLEVCLEAAQAALARLAEPAEIIVVVNGSPAAEYRGLRARFPGVRWRFHARALGFSRAVLDGVRRTRFGAIYLLNNDMRLDADALAALLPWRGGAHFALASQILFPDDGRRREETGWTWMPWQDGLPRPWHAQTPHAVVRGTVWAGAGSALYHAGLLRELLTGCLAYDPFYWEDVDLGLRARERGYESLYVPASRALHLHRVTVRRHYAQAEVERIFERNRLQIALRHPYPPQARGALAARVAALDARSLSELGSLSACLSLWRARRRQWHAAFREIDFEALPVSSHRRVPCAPILWVSPFALLPPRHGGALRTQRLAAELAREHAIVLLSDERGLHAEPIDPSYAPFAAVHLVDGRPEPPAALAQDRLARMRCHAHPALRRELRRLIALHQPRAVIIEHMELAGLIDALDAHGPPCVLSVQDVLLQPDDPAQATADAIERALIARFDGVIVCSPEDQALLGDIASMLVANGCDPATDYAPSQGQELLFAGPFRAEINWRAIVAFLRSAWPAIRAAVPGASLTVLGGPGAKLRAGSEPAFAQAGIEVLEQVDDLRPLLARAALTINPQLGLRGSSLKVLESLAAGRVCVSTVDGARGHRQHGFAGLVECPDVARFADVIVPLLIDPASRRASETPDPERLAACSWRACAEPLREWLASLPGR